MAQQGRASGGDDDASDTGCAVSASVCLTTAAAAAHYVGEKEFSLAIVPDYAVHAPYDKLIAGIRTPKGRVVSPSEQSTQVRGRRLATEIWWTTTRRLNRSWVSIAK